MNKLYSQVSLRMLQFFPRGNSLSSYWWHKIIEFTFVFLTLLLLSCSIYFVSRTDNELSLNIYLFFFISSFVFILTSVLSMLYRFILIWLSRIFKTNIKINPIDPKSWILFCLLIICLLSLHLYYDYKYGAVVFGSNYSSYYDHEKLFGSVSIEGDWVDDKELVKEIRKHKITCDKETEKCIWLTASIQKWNNNYFNIDSTIFPIVEWNNERIRAEIESFNRIEEITIYRDSCKLIYVKSPIKQPDGEFTPDNITLTMKDSYCK